MPRVGSGVRARRARGQSRPPFRGKTRRRARAGRGRGVVDARQDPAPAARGVDAARSRQRNPREPRREPRAQRRALPNPRRARETRAKRSDDRLITGAPDGGQRRRVSVRRLSASSGLARFRPGAAALDPRGRGRGRGRAVRPAGRARAAGRGGRVAGGAEGRRRDDFFPTRRRRRRAARRRKKKRLVSRRETTSPSRFSCLQCGNRRRSRSSRGSPPSAGSSRRT